MRIISLAQYGKKNVCMNLKAFFLNKKKYLRVLFALFLLFFGGCVLIVCGAGKSETGHVNKIKMRL